MATSTKTRQTKKERIIEEIKIGRSASYEEIATRTGAHVDYVRKVAMDANCKDVQLAHCFNAASKLDTQETNALIVDALDYTERLSRNRDLRKLDDIYSADDRLETAREDMEHYAQSARHWKHKWHSTNTVFMRMVPGNRRRRQDAERNFKAHVAALLRAASDIARLEPLAEEDRSADAWEKVQYRWVDRHELSSRAQEAAQARAAERRRQEIESLQRA